MSQPQVPTESERKAFMEKLGQFRSTLTPNEQRLLDGMVLAAFTPQDQGDVKGYAWIWTGAGYVWQPDPPPWYFTVPVYAPMPVVPVGRWVFIP
ncbi:MAG TPA: hypothetical protein VFB73_06500 [Chloroflexota bacterium]|nr:hypothetical protein [Chloroflexota bacterium]HZU05605.1 hypothetical protein [Chloroflexota bacterium]